MNNFRRIIALMIISIFLSSVIFVTLLAQACFWEKGLDHIVINEVYYDVEGSDEGEFVELYNPGWRRVDLSGWYFGDEETAGGGESWNVIPDGVVIWGHSYFIIAKNAEEFMAQQHKMPDLVMPMALSNTGDEVLLSSSSDRADVVDVVA